MTNPMEAVPGLVERLRKYPKHEAPHQAAETLEALSAVLKQRDEYIEHLGKVIADKGPG